jgi:phosphatidylinositol alpha-1,6-mannosyltransferase
MRVLMLSPDFPPGRGGIQRLAGRLAEAMTGDWVTVVALAAKARPDAEAAPQVERVVRIAPPGWLSQPLRVLTYNARALLCAIRLRPRVLLVTHIVAAPAARAASVLLRRPYVLILHGQELGHRPRLMAWAVRRSAATVAVSTYTRGEAVRRGAPADRIVVVNPGVDAPPGGAREPTPLAARPPAIVTVARMVDRYKGHDVMIEALDRLRRTVPAVRWVVVGDGPLKREYEREVELRGLGDVVQFAGSVDDERLEALLAEARVFAMPSRVTPQGGGEGFGLVYLEAAVRGLPVVAGAEGGALDAVRDGHTGLLADPHEPAAVAAALELLLSDDQLAERIGRQAQDDARARTWARFAASVRGQLAEATSATSAGAQPVVMALSHTATVGGAERSLLTQLAADRDSGAFTTVLAAPAGDLLERASGAGFATLAAPAFEPSFRVPPWRLPRELVRLLLAGRRLARLARRSRAELIHANSPRAGLVAGAGRLFGGPPVVTHVRDCMPSSVVARVTRVAIRAASAEVVANSHYTARSFGADRAGRLPRVVYNAVDERFLKPRVPGASPAQRERGSDEQLVAVIGQITPWKGQDTALRAFARVIGRFPDARLAIVGSVKFDGQTRYDNEAFLHELRQIAGRSGLSERVVFSGEVNDVRPLLDACAIVLMPSWEEPFGRVAVEAMAAGRAVAATSVGGPQEFIEHGRNGMLVDPRDTGAWADAIDSLLASPGLRARLAAAGRSDACRRFAPGSAETSMLPVYSDVSPRIAQGFAAFDRAIGDTGLAVAR